MDTMGLGWSSKHMGSLMTPPVPPLSNKTSCIDPRNASSRWFSASVKALATKRNKWYIKTLAWKTLKNTTFFGNCGWFYGSSWSKLPSQRLFPRCLCWEMGTGEEKNHQIIEAVNLLIFWSPPVVDHGKPFKGSLSLNMATRRENTAKS